MQADVRIFRIDGPVREPDILTSDERARASRFRMEKQRLRYLNAHVALRELLAEHLGITPAEVPIAAAMDGKPFLLEHALHFNLTHSGDYAAIAVSHYPVGVDIELFRPDIAWEQIVARRFTERERDWTTSVERFFQLWVKKEAVLKADGRGLQAGLGTFECPFAASGTAVLAAGEYHVSEVDAPEGYFASVAVKA